MGLPEITSGTDSKARELFALASALVSLCVFNLDLHNTLQLYTDFHDFTVYTSPVLTCDRLYSKGISSQK